MSSYRPFLFIALLSGFMIANSLKSICAQEAPERPNVIIILTDDQGYADTGFNGRDIVTPNIDRIADNGVRFTQGYVTHPVCGPSRAGLITGRHQEGFGANRNPLLAPNDSTQGLPLSEQTLADALGGAGYTSSIIGKWHLGAHPLLYPLNRGFDEFFGFLAGGHHYFPEMWTIRDISEVTEQWDGYRTRLMRNNGRVDEDEYLTDALSREAVDFVMRQNENEPFFLYLSYNAPHTPMQATEEYLNRFDHIVDEGRRTYAAMISAVDDGVGNLLNILEEQDMDERTIIFFLSDNGGPTGDNYSDNSPLRGSKGRLYEGGVRVPFAMQWPGVVPSGMTYTDPISSLDIFATAVKYAGVTPKNEIDGVNLIPFLTDDNEGIPHERLFWRTNMRNWKAVLENGYKYHTINGNETELYNLHEDISESNDLSQIMTKKSNRFAEKIEVWQKDLSDALYLGLLENNMYNRKNPDRFVMASPYKPDTLSPQIPDGYKLVWYDEFDTDGPPENSRWNFEEGFVRNQELQWYQPQNAVIEDNCLIFEGRQERIKNRGFDPESNNWRKNREFSEYTSASINTRGKFSFQYGILEVRARVDTSKGAWPAIWTLGDERQWPERGEVDVMEFYRINGVPKILANAAWKGDAGWSPTWDAQRIPLSELLWDMPDWPERFHTWRMKWNSDEIKLYLNDRLLNTINLDEATYDDGFNPFRQPHYILLNLALGSNGGDPSESLFPIFYEVDYVRVFQEK